MPGRGKGKLVVESSLATRQYLIPIKDRISIGSDKRKNLAVIDGQGIEASV